LAGLHEDAASHREVGALDSSEGNLEQSVAVVGVGLQGDALTSRFPRPEHAGSATSAAHVGLAKEDVVAVVQRLQQPAEGTVGRAVRHMRHLLDHDHDPAGHALVGNNLGQLRGQFLFLLRADCAAYPGPEVHQLCAPVAEVEQLHLWVEPLHGLDHRPEVFVLPDCGGPTIVNGPTGSNPRGARVSSAMPKTGMPSTASGRRSASILVGNDPTSGAWLTPLARRSSAREVSALVCSATFVLPPSTATWTSCLSITQRPGGDCSSKTSLGTLSKVYWFGSEIRSTTLREIFAATAVGTAPPRSAVSTACTPMGRPSPRMRMKVW